MSGDGPPQIVLFTSYQGQAGYRYPAFGASEAAEQHFMRNIPIYCTRCDVNSRPDGEVQPPPPPRRFLADGEKQRTAVFWGILWGKPCAISAKQKSLSCRVTEPHQSYFNRWNRESGGPKLPETVPDPSVRSLGAGESAGYWAVEPVTCLAQPVIQSRTLWPLSPREKWCDLFISGCNFLWSWWLRPTKLTHDFHHNPYPKVPEPFLPVPHRHVARGSNVPRNTGRSGPL